MGSLVSVDKAGINQAARSIGIHICSETDTVVSVALHRTVYFKD